MPYRLLVELMAYVYLVKLFGMHKIGRTDNFERRMEQLQPAVLIAKKSTNRSRDLEAELHKHFERKRLPQSEWFSLSPSQVEQCLKFMGANRVKKPKPKKSTAPRRAKRATPEELAKYRKLAGMSEEGP